MGAIQFLDTELGNISMGKTGSLSIGSMYLITFSFQNDRCWKYPFIGCFHIRYSYTGVSYAFLSG